MPKSRLGTSVMIVCLLGSTGVLPVPSPGSPLGAVVPAARAAPDPKTPSAAEPAAAAIRVTFSIESPLASGQIRRLLLGEALTSGDRLAAKIAVSRSAYVYLIRRSAAGQALSVLFPSQAEHELLAPGETLRIPSGSDWFQLGTYRGRVHVTVVASASQLSLKELQQAEAESAPLSKKDAQSSRPRDKPCQPKGQDDCKRGPEDIFEVAANARGIAVLRFPLNQR